MATQTKVLIRDFEYELGPNTDQQTSFDRIYLHGSRKYANVDDLLRYHRGRGFAGIGYHFTITRSGDIFATRPLDIQGAHVYGRNKGSVGIVLLNIDESGENPAIAHSFRELYDYISGIKDERLPVLSHTYGQFEYLNQKIDEYNKKGRGYVPNVPFGPEIAGTRLLQSTKRVLDDTIMIIELDQKLENDSNFRELRELIRDLKACPGDAYFPFTEGLPREYGMKHG